MSKITLTDDAGNAQDIALPSNVGVTVTLAPPVSPPPPPPPSGTPTIIGQTLTADKTEIRVGDTFTVTGIIDYSDGSTAPVKTYAMGESPKGIVAHTPPGNWIRTFTAVTAGAVRIQNSSNGTTGKLDLVVLNADGSAPINPPNDPTPPVNPITPIPPTNGNATHMVVATVTDRLNRAWVATATVGNDATQPMVFAPFVGPDISSLVADPPADPDPSLPPAPHPALRLRAYADGCEIGAQLASNAFDWLGFELSVTYDGMAVPLPPLSNDDGTVDFWRGCVSPMLRYGTQVGWDATKIDQSLLPSYTSDPGSCGDSHMDYRFNGRGCATYAGMGGPGERNDIGYLPAWDVAFVTNPNDATWGVCRRSADHDGWWPVFYCTDSGYIVDNVTWPDANTLSALQRSKKWNNPIVVYRGSYDGNTLTLPSDQWATTKCPNLPNGAHLTRYGMLAAMITGTAHDKDHASFWANWTLLEINPAYTKSGGCMTGPQRRAAWCLASLFLASYVARDEDRAYFANEVAHNLAVANAIPKNQFGVLDTDLAYKGKGSASGCIGVAIWQINYVMETLDAVSHKDAAWIPFTQYVGGFYAQIAATPQAPLATIYFWIFHDANGNVISDLMTQCRYSLVSNGWTEAEASAITVPGLTNQNVFDQINAHYTALGKKWSGKIVNGVCDYIGAITASDSYPAGDIMATVAAHNAGTPGIDVAIARVQGLPTKPNYGNNQKYHLSPRSGS